MTGQTVAHYSLLEKIGSGGMGEVWLAEDTRLERQVALKFLPKHLTADREARERFEREAKAAAALNHPNIITVYEIGEHEGQVFIAMEYVEGRTLKELISGSVGANNYSPLPIDQVLSIATQTASGLSAAHAKGIVHRDIKPQNILVDKGGHVKILDFGLAKLKGVSSLTKESSTLGTVHYMSPEQTMGKDVDHRTDIWSLGVVLYEILTGRPPFKGDYEQAVIYSILNEEPEALENLRPDAPAELQAIIGKCLEKELDIRYQHADDLLADLMRARRDRKPVTAARPQPKAPGNRRHRPVVGMIMAVAVIALLVFLFSPFKVHVGPRETTQAKENSLAVMYFENLQDPEDKNKTAQMITALLTTSLSDSPRYMQVVSSQRLFDILKLLGKADLKIIDKTVASEVAAKAKVQWMVTGKLLKEEPNIAVVSEISDAATGKILATQKVNGAPGEDLFAVVDKLSPQVVKALALPKQAQKELSKPITELTTHSQEAYRCYLEGIENYYKLYYSDAVKNFEQALAFDPGFAGAYLRLAIIHIDRGEAQGGERLAQATKYLTGMSQKERLIAESVTAYLAGRYEKSIKSFEEIIDRFPDEKEACLFLGSMYRELHNHKERIRWLNRAIAIDPLYKPAYNDLAYAYDIIGDFEKSLWAINKYMDLAPNEANPYGSRGDLYMFNGRMDEAIESFQKSLSLKPDFWGSLYRIAILRMFKKEFAEAQRIFKELVASKDPRYRFWGRTALATIPAYRGKFKEALTVLSDIMAANEREHYAGFERGYNHVNKARLHEERGELDLALTETQKSRDFFMKTEPILHNWFSDYYVYLLAKRGKMAEAEALARQVKTDSETNWLLRFRYLRAEGVLALSRDDIQSARNSLERDQSICLWTTILLARIYLEQGILDKAVELLEKTLTHNYFLYDDRFFYPVLTVKAHYLLGQAYEKSGWKDKAIRKYKEFLDIWKDADPGIPEVIDAQKKLAKLKKL